MAVVRDSTILIRQKARAALTVIELAATLAIMTVLATIALNGVFGARESSRQVTCISNLRNWSLALAGYEGTHRVLPCGYDSRSTSAASGGIHDISAAPLLLPYLDEFKTYQSINMQAIGLSRYYQAGQSPQVFKCPSDVFADSQSLSYVVSGGVFAVVSNPQFLAPGEPNFFGAFDAQSGVSLSAITDGLANTAFVSERLVGSLPNNLSEAEHGIQGRDTMLRKDLPPASHVNRWLQDCIDALGTRTSWYTDQGRNWLFARDANYNHIAPPNARTNCGALFATPYPGVRAATSQHRGNVDVLFGDGSVRKITNDIDLEVWRALGTRSNGEPIPDDS